MKDITTDLHDRLALLNLRFAVVYGDVKYELPDNYAERAERIVTGLRDDDAHAVAFVRALVDPADLDRSSFWSTSLGRLLFAAGGYPDECVGQAFAAGVLGCSRQWVHELISRGALGRDDSSPVLVPVAGVRELLKARIDELVK